MTSKPTGHWPAIAIVLVNVVAAAVLYLVVGWHFVRGYKEVVNFVVVALIQILAGLNAGVAVIVGCWILIMRRWKMAPRASAVAKGLGVSAVLLLCSPLFVPTIGRFANHHGLLHTPLVEAARYGDGKLVAILLKEGANPNVKHHALGTTPLHYMAQDGSHEVVELLLESGADPNAREDTSMATPLHWAVASRANLRTIELLAEHGADPTLEDWHGETPLEYARRIPEPKASAINRVFGRGGMPKEAN